MNKKTIILTITNLAGSGAEKVVLNLFSMFEKNEIDVHIIMLENTVSYDIDFIPKSNIHYLSNSRNKYKLFSTFGDFLLHRKLEKLLKKIENKTNNQIDLILSNLPASDRVLHFSKRKRIFFCIHTSYYQEILEFKAKDKLFVAKRKESLYKKIYENKDLIIVSNQIKDDLNKLNINYNSIESIYNPFDFDDINRKGLEKVKDFDLQRDYIISASAFRFVKRYDILLDAYKKSKVDLRLVLLCNETDGLNQMIKERDLCEKVEILGFKINPYPYIKNAKFLILSSEREGLPTVLVESLILKTPVVSTNCISGPNEILTGDLSNYLAKVNNSSDLAKKIKLLLDDNPIIYDKYLTKFDEKNIYKKYIALINSHK